MSDAEDKRIPESSQPVPEGVGSGKGDPAKDTGRDLPSTMKQVGAHLRHLFSEDIAQDARRFKKLAVHHLRRSLPPFPGRPPEAALTKAIGLRKQGLEWKQIYPQCIPNHSSLPPTERRQAESNLRGACRSRRNARKRRRRARADAGAEGEAPQR